MTENMYIMLPYESLLDPDEVMACDDWDQACTEFCFLVMNTGDVTAGAWYTVSIVGGATLYSGTVPVLAPGVGSSYIEDWICALPGGLPVGTHTIEVEVGPEGMAATDSYSEDLFVIEELLPPIVDTDIAKDITTTSAVLWGYLVDGRGLLTNAGFEYGETTSYGTTTWVGEFYTLGWYEKTIASLDPGTLYHFRAIANNAYGRGYGADATFTTLSAPVYDMYIILPNANGTLFLSNTITACDDPATACTEFRFLIMNTGDVTASAWYSVSVVGGATLYSGSVHNLAPGVGSSYIEDWICALPGGLPVGTHTIKVEVGVEGQAATDSYTEDIFVIEEPVIGMQIVLPNTSLLDKAELVYSERSDLGWTDYNFQIQNNTATTIAPWFKLYVNTTLVNYGTLDSLTSGAVSAIVNDGLSAIEEGITVGTHTVLLEVGPDGMAATDTHTEQLTVLEPYAPSGVYAVGETYLNVCGAEIANNCITVDVVVEHFGSDNECSVYLEYWSEGDTEHNFTTPIVVPYDPLYDEEGGLEVQGVTVCIPNCELDHYIRTVASNSVGTSYGETVTPITVRLEAPTEITQTSVTLNGSIVSMGSVTTGVANFRHGTPTPDTYGCTSFSLSSPGAISCTITGLVPNTTYQYYLYARYQYGYPQTHSGTMSFTTLPEQIPNDATFVSQTVPLSMALGESYEVSITMQNTGTATWTEEDYYRLGIPNLIWGFDRVYLPAGTTVLPGAEWTFTFSITAPTEAGDYNFQWVMVQEGVEVFGEYTENLIISVTTPSNDATFVSQTVPLSMVAGGSYEVSITMRNSGSATWTHEANYSLGAQNQHWGDGLAYGRAYLPIGGTVLPGAEWAFTFSITAPTEAGNYNFQWRMVEEWVEHFGELTENLLIAVVPASYDLTFIATAPGISDLHNVDVNDVTDPGNPLYLGKT